MPGDTQESNSKSFLSGLNTPQRSAAEHTTGALLIVAGAGAGKTRTLTHRIANLIDSGIPAQKILAITFTNKAAKELRERLHKLLGGGGHMPLAATFHSLGVQILRQYASHLDLKPSFAIIDRGDQERLVKEILKELGFGSSDSGNQQWTPGKVLGYISNRRSGKAAPLSQLEAVCERYRVLKKERSVLDFDDLIYRTVDLLRDSEVVRTELQNRWSHLHVDEYQDTNRQQYELVRLLAGEAGNVCAVGDTDQTIYTWRGAEIKNLLQFEKDFKNTTTVLLEENYRSSKTIIAVANDCIRKNQARIEKTLFTNNQDGELLEVIIGSDENDEARQIVGEIQDLINSGVNPSEIAILYRANFLSQSLEKAFISRGLNYELLGTKFYNRKEIKDMMAYLRYAINPDNPADLERIASVPKRGIGPKTVMAMITNQTETLGAGARSKANKFQTLLDKIREQVQTKPPHEVMEYILTETGWATSLDPEAETLKVDPKAPWRTKKAADDGNQERLDNLAELINVASEYAEYEAPLGTQKLLEEAALMAEADTATDGEKTPAVRMMTIHASKGLEFDHVFITGLEQGLFPSDRSDAASEQEEERRLFYVALTRARKKAYLSYATMRRRFGSFNFNTPSEFITEIDPQYLKPDTSHNFSTGSSSGGMGLLDDIDF